MDSAYSRTQTTANAAGPRRRWGPKTVLLGLALVAGLLLVGRHLGWGAPWLDTPWRLRAERPELQELIDALKREQVRPGEARLMGGFGYAPPPGVDGPERGVDVRLAAVHIERRAAADGSPEQHAALAVARLVLGDVDAAIDGLEGLVAQQPRNAVFNNDLAAAYLARSTRPNHAADVARAFAAVSRARAVDGESAAIKFTHALALERLRLDALAAQSWRDYLRTTPADAWADEARRHVAALARVSRREQWTAARVRILESAGRGDLKATGEQVSAFREASRELLDDELLPQLGEAIVAGTRDEPLRTTVSTLASALSTLEQDPLPERSARALTLAQDGGRDARSAPDQPRRLTIAQGHVTWREARRVYNAYRFADAAALFERCERELAAGGSPFAIWARFQRAVSDYQLRQLERATALLLDVLHTSVASRYHSVAGRAHWVLGSLRSNTGAFDEADTHFRAARRRFEEAGAREQVANVDVLLAENFGWLGEQEEAWTHLLAGLEMFDALRDPRRRQAMMYVGGVLAARQRLPEAGLVFQEGYLEAAREGGVSSSVAEGLVRRAATFHQLQDADRALADLAEARRLSSSADRAQSAWIDALAAEVEGDLWRRGEPARSRQSIDAAIAYAQRAGRENRLPTLWLARGRTNRAAGRAAEAAQDYHRGVEVFEKLRQGLSTESMRLSFFDAAWDLYADATDLLATADQIEPALAMAERGRARDLADRVTDGASGALLPRVRASLDANTAIAFYASLDERLLVWVIRRDDVRLVSRALRAEALGRSVEQFRRAVIAGDDARQADAGTALYRELLAPLEPLLPAGGRLLIVPDGGLHALPFTSLKTPRGQYLIAERAVSTIPNLRFLAEANRQTPRLPLQTALIVGNPTLRGDAVANLPTLTFAAREAKEIGTLYPAATLLEGATATKAAFLDGISRANVVHFAGHTVPVASFPGLSRLVLAPAPGGDASDSLDAREITRREYPRTHVVVLAACRTAIGPQYRAEGPMSLARPFLASGVRSVVATLWDTDDRSSAVFFTRFHKALLTGMSAGDALRHAQLELAGATDPVLKRPSAWAGMVLYGTN